MLDLRFFWLVGFFSGRNSLGVSYWFVFVGPVFSFGGGLSVCFGVGFFLLFSFGFRVFLLLIC